MNSTSFAWKLTSAGWCKVTYRYGQVVSVEPSFANFDPDPTYPTGIMAVAGGACSAYRCWMIGGKLYVTATSTLRALCTPVDEAMERLAQGELVTVAGADMAALRLRLATDKTEGE